MKCVVCSSIVPEVNHIAIDDNGDPVVLCDRCHDKVRIFFEEVKYRGNSQFRRSVARSEQEV